MSHVIVLGAPFSVGCREETSFAIDQQRAPAAIRRAYDDTMQGFDIPRCFEDVGDVEADHSVEAVLSALERRSTEISSRGDIPLLLGGAHTITLGGLRGLKRSLAEFSFVCFDAHPDLMPHPDINYGSSLYYAVKEGVVDPSRIALLGVRQIERAEERFIKEHGIYALPPLEFEHRGARAIADEILAKFPPPYAVSIDLDALELAFCPGVTTPFPGGLSFREVLYVANRLCQQETRYLDIVELSPVNDRNEESARLGAILLHQLTTTIAQVHGTREI